MAKSTYNVTVPATITAVVEASDDKDAADKFRILAKAVFGNMLGVISIVGDPKVVHTGKTKVSKDADKDEDEKEEEEEDEDEDEDEKEEEEEDEDEDEKEDEEEEEEDEDEKPSKKSDKKTDKKSTKKSDDGKKKIKIKLRG